MMNEFNKLDEIGQNKILPTLYYLFRNCYLQIEQHIEDKGHIDIYMTATTQANKEKYYAIECKHRNMEHTKYDDYILEYSKEKYLKENSKYTPIYANSFDDGYVIFWDLSKNNEIKNIGEKTYSKYTVIPSKRYVENKQAINVKSAVWIGKMK